MYGAGLGCCWPSGTSLRTGRLSPGMMGTDGSEQASAQQPRPVPSRWSRSECAIVRAPAVLTALSAALQWASRGPRRQEGGRTHSREATDRTQLRKSEKERESGRGVDEKRA